jgi:hypothetical protein
MQRVLPPFLLLLSPHKPLLLFRLPQLSLLALLLLKSRFHLRQSHFVVPSLVAPPIARWPILAVLLLVLRSRRRCMRW